jgi:anhydro-N-acetylmuramic acid kinase
MIYRAIGTMSGSSLDGLDLCFAEFVEDGGSWAYQIRAADCYPYPAGWRKRLEAATSLSARDYLLLHTEFGHYIGQEVNRFVADNQLDYQVAIISSHGHTSFHLPALRTTAQLGDGATIAAATQLPVVSDLRALDVAFGGQGAPIVPIGEKWLLRDHKLFLNLGGIANISFHSASYAAFDVCPANRVLNMLASQAGHEFDEGGAMAAAGSVDARLLAALNGLAYYEQGYPKSLHNEFGTETIYPMLREAALAAPDALRTYVEHIVEQIKSAVERFDVNSGEKMLATGGGAFNSFLIHRLQEVLAEVNIEVVVPDNSLVKFKEAMIMAFIGVLRWRQEDTVLSSVTGAARNSIGGALWIGQEA